MSGKTIIKGGRVIDPASGLDGIRDILIEAGKIASIGKNIPAKDAVIIQAGGKIVCPGFIDMHAHLREPGREDEETILTGTMAAARGGYAAVACMPNTSPPADSASVIRFILKKAECAGYSRVLPVGCVSRGLEGKELAEIGELAEAGAVAVSDDGEPVSSSALMRRAMEYASMFGLPVISHCEDKSFPPGVMNEGLTSAILGLPGIPAACEEVMAARDIALASLTGARLHIAHVSTAGTVDLIRKAKSSGISVTAETAPHYFTLTDELVASFNTNLRINPPLRGKNDVLAVKEGLKDGTIDAIATDHAPHTAVEKEEEFELAPPGTIGLETCLPLVLGELVEGGVLTLPEAVGKLTLVPAEILNVEGGRLAAGENADICVFDPGKEWRAGGEQFFSMSKNSAFEGMMLRGAVEEMILSGRTVFSRGKFTD